VQGRAAVKTTFLLPGALVSVLLLSACGTRSSLPAPGESTACRSWSARDGAAGLWRGAGGPIALLGDGSVVTVMSELGGAAGSSEYDLPRVQKWDAHGEVAWKADGEVDEVGFLSTARDAADGVYLAGYTNPGVHAALGATLACPGAGYCTFFGKLDETGTLEWSKVVSSDAPYGVYSDELAVTGDGRITLAGSFQGTIDVGCGPHTATAGGSSTTRYLAQLSPLGECLWSRAIVGTPTFEAGFGRIAVDDAGEVALAVGVRTQGAAWGLDLGAGPMPFDADSGWGIAVAKYAPDGGLLFANATSVEVALGVSVAMTGAGEVLLSAGLGGMVEFGGGLEGSPGTLRYAVTRFGLQGEEVWTRDILTDQFLTQNSAFPIVARPSGGFFLVGQGAPGMAIHGETTPETALFAAAYDAGGLPLSVETFPFTGLSFIRGLAASADGVVLVGGLQGTIDFGQGTLASEGTQDAFVARICR
jgi:hypothetical protein